MLKSYDSPKNGDYVSYIEALVKQSSMSSATQNKADDIFQSSPGNFPDDEDFSSDTPVNPTTYTLPPTRKTADRKHSVTYTASAFNKNIRRFFFLIFLVVFLGSILAKSDGQGAIVFLIIVAIALFRFMASVFKSTKSNRKNENRLR